MNKMLMLIMVLGLVTLPVNWTGPSSSNVAAADNIPQAASSNIAIGIQSDDGSVCIVSLEIPDAGRPGLAAASAQADIINQLPDVTTLVLLGFGGLLYRRRKE